MGLLLGGIDAAAFSHLARAARRAISLRFFDDSDAARALPPLAPPSFPSATAAGFFGGPFGGVLRLIAGGNTADLVREHIHIARHA